MNEELKFLAEIGVDIDFSILHQSDPKKLIKLLQTKTRLIIQELEKNSKQYFEMGEVGLTAFISSGLKSGGVFHTTTEQNSRGHVDLTVTAPMFSNTLAFEVKAEAKIWSGYSTTSGGFTQMQGYLTGNPPQAMMLYYFKTKSCDDLFDAYIDALISAEGGTRTLKETRFSITQHAHTGGFNFTLDHYAAWVNQ